MSKKYRSDAMAAIHETMEALHDVGAVGKQAMRRSTTPALRRFGHCGLHRSRRFGRERTSAKPFSPTT
jgi:DNA-binding transcriptional regulator YiaG